ncbi:MerR family transcriptional regulator [Bifidobacterium pseudolongum]|uniref:MerR family transcriptional regulator n=1 Tax=Bifidobacterium pseudolongum TaxID=1694 RepID=UPI001021B60A|nr:MerR family transcriptional regulator [Bifidobacterium pseudolongum]RYQ64020.1 transcriptional regulator [Bifidobacterium pseudolongum subsp. globosum]
MYTMKQACEMTGMNYEALKFYCNSGLVPRVQRDSRNRRVFDDRNIAWIKSLSCLKRCGLSIAEMRRYTELCLLGESSIPDRMQILAEKREELQHRMQDIQDSIEYIDSKERFFEGVLDGSITYYSNVLTADGD